MAEMTVMPPMGRPVARCFAGVATKAGLKRFIMKQEEQARHREARSCGVRIDSTAFGQVKVLEDLCERKDEQILKLQKHLEVCKLKHPQAESIRSKES